jgi:hypothetical protein
MVQASVTSAPLHAFDGVFFLLPERNCNSPAEAARDILDRMGLSRQMVMWDNEN